MRIAKYTRGIKHTPGAEFLPGDVILFAGQGDLYSRVGGWLVRGSREGPTYAVHTAQFLDGGRVLEMDMVARIKSLDDLLQKRYKLNLWKRRGFEVWRCQRLTDPQREALTREALTYVNVKFGALKFGAHLIDNVVGKLLHRDVFFFRRLDQNGRRPVCSEIIALVYDKAMNYRFGVSPECADPDHIHDWVTGHPDEWARVFYLEAYSKV